MAQDNWWGGDAVVSQAPAKSGPLPSPAKEVDPFKASSEARAIEDQERQRQKQIRDDLEWNATHNPDGTLKPKTGGDATAEQNKVTTLLTRIVGGANDITGVTSNNPEADRPGFIESVRGDLMPGGVGGVVTRGIAGENRRTVHDAQRDMLDAMLTLGTGAAYNAEQLSGQMASYFPQYGDSQAEADVKTNRLKRLMEAAKVNAGPRWAEIEAKIAPFMATLGAAEATTTPQDDKQTPPVGVANAPAMSGGLPTGTPIKFGMDSEAEGPFDRTAWLKENYGVTPDQEATATAFWNANSGNQNLTPDAVAQWYRSNGIPVPAPEVIASGITNAKSGAHFSGYDSSAAEKAYRDQLQSRLDKMGFDPNSAGAYSDRVGQGAKLGLSDELYGLQGAKDALFGNEGVVDGYILNRDTARLAQEQSAERQGLLGNALEFGGGLATGLAIPGGAVRSGLVGGATAGFGYGEGTTNSLANMFLGGAGGAALGGATSKIASRGGRTVEEMAMPPVADDIAPTPPAPEPQPFTVSGSTTIPGAAAPTAAVTQEAGEEIGTLVRAASGTGKKAQEAQARLAQMAKVNPEAKAAADRLGFELPADVFADDAAVREAVGLTRSVAGSEASGAWRDAVTNALDQGDNVLKEFDAAFVEGAPAPGATSQRVKGSLTSTRESLNRTASKMYSDVDAKVPKQTPVNMNNLFNTLTDIASEVGEGGMSGAEKKLLNLIQSGEAGSADITYGRLLREKNLIGKALRKEESPYGSMAEADLKRLYSALSEDQLAVAEQVGGKELRSQLHGANRIYAQERALGERIVKAFGQDIEGSIAGKMRASITDAAKGDGGAFARMIKAVPEDLRKEVVATAIASVARSNRANAPGFGFAEFAKLYPNLKANPEVFKQVTDILGEGSAQKLRDLFVVSKRLTDARANVLTTGKANQGMVGAMQAEGLANKIMSSAGAQRVVGAAASMVPGGGAVVPDIARWMASKGGNDAVAEAGRLFSSDAFQNLMTASVENPAAVDQAIGNVVTSPAWKRFAFRAGLPKNPREAATWLRTGLSQNVDLGAAVAQSPLRAAATGQDEGDSRRIPIQ